MTIDYEPMWAVVDAHRHAADALEAALREATGDRPEPEEPDKINTHNTAIMALEDAASVLLEMADRDGHSVTHAHANKCRVIARRCDHVLKELIKMGEL